jgi:hypothetical protein
MDDQRTDRDGGEPWPWNLITPGNREPHVFPFCIAFWLLAVFWCWRDPGFWSYKSLIGMSFAVALLGLDKLRLKVIREQKK